jgi:outer membrane lipoprotein-sorting protein
MRFATLTLSLVMLAAAGAAHAQAPINSHLPQVRDIALSSKIVSRDMAELRKISRDFAQSYRFASSEVFYKEPNRLRVNSRAGAITVSYVINGNTKVYRAGAAVRNDISNKPKERQTAMLAGVLTPAFLQMFNVSGAGTGTFAGRSVHVYNLRYRQEPDGLWVRLSVDPQRKLVIRQQEFHADGSMKLDVRFLNPQQVSGVWVPTRLEVYNGEGKLGAVTEVSNIRVNTGLADSLFSV